jgi:hypothetical protein
MLKMQKTAYLLEYSGSDTEKNFFEALKIATDGGPCCFISPYLNFVNEKTKNKDPYSFTGEDYHSQPKGSKNGQNNGLQLVLDVESFDYTYSGKESMGFKIEFSDPRDMSIIKQGGYSISPGTNFSFSFFMFHLSLYFSFS